MNDSVVLIQTDDTPSRRIVEIDLDDFDNILGREQSPAPQKQENGEKQTLEESRLDQSLEAIRSLRSELFAERIASGAKIQFLEGLVRDLQRENADLKAALEARGQ